MMPRPRDRSAAAPRLSVSVVTHDSERCLPELLAGLARQEGVTWEVRFVDCASRDGTREILRAAALGELEASAENLGYGRGHNRNLAHARGEHVLLLNPDLHLGPGLFAGLVAHLDAHPEHGLVGPQILEGEARRPFPPRRFYPGEGMIALEPELRRRELAWLSGCCLAARRRVLIELGGFDPDFFLYQAETDLCLRARRAGHRLGYAEQLVVHHLHRQSQRALSDYEHARRIFEGSALFWQKHYAPRDVRRLARFQLALCRLLLPAAHAFGRARRWPSQLAAPRLGARRDLCRRLVAAAPPASHAPGRGASILVRQLRLALAWLAAGSFPLDDY